jgi:hypothetical protein
MSSKCCRDVFAEIGFRDENPNGGTCRVSDVGCGWKSRREECNEQQGGRCVEAKEAREKSCGRRPWGAARLGLTGAQGQPTPAAGG